MKIVFFPITSAQVHTCRNFIIELAGKSHETKVIVRDHDNSLALLEAHKIEYVVCGKAGGRGYTKYLEAIPLLCKACLTAKRCNPDCIFGFGSPSALICLLLRKPCILLGDTDIGSIQLLLLKHNPYVKAIITPKAFRLNLGRAHFKLNFYKELAYLHPTRFEPDESILKELGVGVNDKYVIVRFNAFDAVHDIGAKGFDDIHKIKLINEILKHCRVFISAEGILPASLKPYLIPIHPARIHHAVYYSSLFVCDTGTMATEAAVLGIPTVICHPAVNELSNFVELENTYGLLFRFLNADAAIAKAIELLNQPNLKEEWQSKRWKMLEDKVDLTGFLVDFIEGWPESLRRLKAEQAKS